MRRSEALASALLAAAVLFSFVGATASTVPLITAALVGAVAALTLIAAVVLRGLASPRPPEPHALDNRYRGPADWLAIQTLLLHVDGLFHMRVNFFLILEGLFVAGFTQLGRE